MEAAPRQDKGFDFQYLFIIISNSVLITISYSDMDITETDINRSESDIPYSDTKWYYFTIIEVMQDLLYRLDINTVQNRP